VVNKENRAIGAGLGIAGFFIALLAMLNMGLTLNQLGVVALSGAGFLISAVLGTVLYDFMLDNVSKKLSLAGGSTLALGIIIVLLMPFVSASFGQVAGYGMQPANAGTNQPAKPSYMRGAVVDALSQPQVAISDASIKYYDTEPTAGVGKVALYTDNTDSTGSFMTEIEEHAGTHLWATASKSGYYAEKDDGLTGATGSGATNLNFNNYAKGLTKIGTLSKRITNAEPADNITINSSGDIVLDNAAADTFTFDLVIEDPDSATALRDLYFSADDGSAYDNETVEMEIPTAENPDYGTLTANVVSGKLAWGNGINQTEIQCDGDLQYRKDLVIHFRITSDDGTTGTVIDFEDADDLSGQVGLEGGTGIANQPFQVITQ